MTLNASYDLDLFGKNRAALAASVSDREAARADAAQARLTLSTAVAQAYGELIRLSSERNASVETLKDRTATASLESQRVTNGLDTRGQSDQAAAAVPTAQADVEMLDAQILVARHRVAALLGQGPDRGLEIAVPAGESVKTFGLPDNLAVNLIGRRPDIVAAKLRAQSAAKRIDVAHAAFYPNITLNGYIGQSAFGIGDLFKPIAATGQFGPAIDLPIFEGGRLQGQYRGARADYDAAVASYDMTLTQALQDVADAAANAQSSTRQLDERRASLSKGESAYASAKARYEGGLSTYIDLLVAEDAVIVERRALADARAAAFLDDIALVRALGGGFAS